MKQGLFLLLGCFLFASCASSPPGSERGPQGTIAYYIQVESDPPGARVETNGEYVGNTPLTIKVFGDPDGTFHNFANQNKYTISATLPGQQTQTKTYGAGGWFAPEDMIPKKVLFTFSSEAK